jgi:hypothetical protein
MRCASSSAYAAHRIKSHRNPIGLYLLSKHLYQARILVERFFKKTRDTAALQPATAGPPRKPSVALSSSWPASGYAATSVRPCLHCCSSKVPNRAFGEERRRNEPCLHV